MSRRTEIHVGVMVLVALAILVVGVTWLKEFSLARKQKVWMVHFEQTGGLAQSDEVQVNGLRKGDVQKVDLVGDGVLVRLALASDIRLSHDCVVSIRNVGLMGEKVIFVTWKDSGEPWTARDTIPGVYEKGIPEVMAALGPAVGTVEMLTSQLQSIALELNKHGDITESIKNLRVASEHLRLAVQENRTALKQTLGNFQAASQTTRALTTDREAQLRATMDHFQSSAQKLDRLAGRMDSLSASLQQSRGTLGKLVNDDKVYEDMRSTLAELKGLIADVKAHPKKYLTVKIF